MTRVQAKIKGSEQLKLEVSVNHRLANALSGIPMDEIASALERIYLADQLFCYWKSSDRRIFGWAHLWAKTVEGFNPADHCINCLVGRRLRDFKPEMPPNAPLALPIKQSQIVYFCGVATSFQLAENFHLPVRRRPGKIATRSAYTGDELVVLNAEEIVFDDYIAKTKFPHLSHKYLRCRNFQFAAQEFAEE